MKPIEPGCLAIIVGARNPENIGKTVKVIRRVRAGELLSVKGRDNERVRVSFNTGPNPWEIESVIGRIKNSYTSLSGVSYHVEESTGIIKEPWLRRIDDHEPDAFDREILNLEQEKPHDGIRVGSK